MSILDDFLKIFEGLKENKTTVYPQKGLDRNREPTKKYDRDPEDKLSPNLYIGKIIADSNIVVEVVDVHKTNIHVKIMEIMWPRLGTYLDVGETYPVFKHSGWDDKTIQVWEIAPKHMKRSTSQVILQWEEQLGWCWDLDS